MKNFILTALTVLVSLTTQAQQPGKHVYYLVVITVAVGVGIVMAQLGAVGLSVERAVDVPALTGFGATIGTTESK